MPPPRQQKDPVPSLPDETGEGGVFVAAAREKLWPWSVDSLDDLSALAPGQRLGAGSTTSTASDASKALPDYSDGDEVAGRYVLVGVGPNRGPLGRGAFGEVWQAYESEFDRSVALKILRTQTCGPTAFLRFELEKQVLARMQHPNIARVYDGGLARDREPYLAMELIEGRTLADYCALHCLSLPDRLQLFVSICRAIHHAHERLVLHRDLKPSNIMIVEEAGRPVPKVIDFGIAKILDDGAFSAGLATTVEGFVKGSPAYMSPEQTRGNEQLTVRSDVYSLGVLLFELLTGETPLSLQGHAPFDFVELLSAIRDADPIAPSSATQMRGARKSPTPTIAGVDRTDLTRHLRGELDVIVLRATRKAPSERYETAAALADDLERYLRQEPILARPPTNWYRFTRFVQRRKALAVAGGIAFCALLGTGVAVTTSYLSVRSALARERLALHAQAQATSTAVQKQKEAFEAERRAEDARKLAEQKRSEATTSRDSAVLARHQAEELINYMLFDLRRQLEPLGRSRLLAGVGEKAEEYFSQQPASTEDDQLERNRGIVSFNRGYLLLAQGDVPHAMDAFEKARTAMARRLQDKEEAGRHLDYALASHGLAIALRASNRHEEAEALLVKQTPFLRTRHDERDPEATKLLAANLEQLGELRQRGGSLPSALLFFSEEEQCLREAKPEATAASSVSFNLAIACEKIGTALLALGRREEARVKFEEEVRLLRSLVGEELDNLQMRRSFAVSLEHLGNALLASGKLHSALECFQERLSESEVLARVDRKRIDFRHDLAVAHHSMANVLLSLRDYPAALVHAAEGLRISLSLAHENPLDPSTRRDLAASYFGMGIAKVKAAPGSPAKVADAKRDFQKVSEILSQLAKDNALDSEGLQALAAAEEALKSLSVSRTDVAASLDR